MADFAHLHCHTEYSLLDGAIRVKDLCQKTVEYGLDACAITDHGNMYGAAYFYSACREAGIKPILGCEVYVCRNHADKNPETGKKRNHLILLARNNAGYHNLIKLVSEAYLKGYYYKPRVDKTLLRRYSEGLICLSACLSGEIPSAILENDFDAARNLVREYADIFPGRFYLELQENGLDDQKKANNGLAELAESEKIPLVATNDCHYLNRDDAYAHEVLLCIQTQTTMDDAGRMRFDTDEFYYKPPREMARDFAAFPQALANTAEIAASCNVELDFGHHYFPVYPVPEGSSAAAEFRRLSEEGLERRLAAHPGRDRLDIAKYRERLAHELDVIEEMGFSGYFLIVQEFINWAKDRGIPVGPGRGSAAGSLVAWALRITNLDPLPYNLLFERFLNNERVSLPDIDVDFCERRRGEVIRHMVERYGEGAVAQITTFGTMKAKGVIRDVGRALGMSYADTDKIARLVPNELKMDIDTALKQEPDLKRLHDSDKQVRHLIDTARKLEGLARHASTHAAGLVVSDKPMEEYLPLYIGKRGEMVTQFDGPMTEQIGLVKFDFLGLKTMTLIQDTLDNISRQGREVPNLDILDLSDQEVYDLYSRGDTEGVFQVESPGMRQYLRMLKPNCFEDIIAMLALYRPGPLGSGMVDEFIKRKHGQTRVVYPHEWLENCLKDTYGVIVYQEQVMQIAQIVANYTLGGADLLRRAMGKKKKEVMASERTRFVEGAAKNGIRDRQANEIFDLMVKFADYGFNKSHSAAYALISYYTAWLKTHYPVEFMAALLSSEMGNQDKLLKYISACKDMEISVIQPSVNASERDFSASEGQVVFGLGGIKNVGDEAIREIVSSRKKDGPFKSFYDMCCRVNQRKVTKRVLESLVKGGACDCFGITRAALLACLEIAANRAQKSSRQNQSPQASLLGMVAKPEEPVNGLGLEMQEAYLEEMSEEQKMASEKEALGFFLTSHPLQPFSREIRRANLATIESCLDRQSGATVSLPCLVTNVKEVLTKSKGERMAFLTIEDLTGHAEITFFPKSYAHLRELLNSGRPLCVTAKLERSGNRENGGEEDEAQEEEIKFLGESARLLEEVCSANAAPVVIKIPGSKLTREDLDGLRKILEKYAGPVNVHAIVELENYECVLHLPESLTVSPGRELEKELAQWLAA